jgi:WD40 repeat protein
MTLAPAPEFPPIDLTAPAIEKLPFRTTAIVHRALAQLGRTEDIRFSPSNRLLAIAGFARKKVLLLSVNIAEDRQGLSLTATDHLVLLSPDISQVHGLDFIDEGTLVVANRDACLAVFKLPTGAFTGGEVTLNAVRRVKRTPLCRMKAPGSVVVRHETRGRISLLVCNNSADHITRHVLLPRFRYAILRNHIVLRHGLDIPDGIAVSPDDRWLAVSSHVDHDVKIYDASRPLHPDMQPVGILDGIQYPHGLRFTPEGKQVIVADAGTRCVNVYQSNGDWTGLRKPKHQLNVLEAAAFQRGRHNPQEGGPKGLDVDRTGRVVAVTCEEQVVGFYPLSAMID